MRILIFALSVLLLTSTFAQQAPSSSSSVSSTPSKSSSSTSSEQTIDSSNQNLNNTLQDSQTADACQADLEFINNMVSRIKEDIENKNLNDFVNDVFYLNGELPQAYNDCTTSSNTQQLADTYVSALGNITSTLCNEQVTQEVEPVLKNIAGLLSSENFSKLAISIQVIRLVADFKQCFSAL
jgi:hypothetical protein